MPVEETQITSKCEHIRELTDALSDAEERYPEIVEQTRETRLKMQSFASILFAGTETAAMFTLHAARCNDGCGAMVAVIAGAAAAYAALSWQENRQKFDGSENERLTLLNRIRKKLLVVLSEDTFLRNAAAEAGVYYRDLSVNV